MSSQPSADEIVKGLQAITQQMQQLQAPAQSITIINAPLIVIGQGPVPQVISGLSSVIATVSSQVAVMGGAKENYDDKADAVFNAVREYTRVSQATLNILIGKAGLFQQLPLLGAPMSAALRALDGADDALLFKIIDKIPSKAKDTQAQFDSLNETQKLAITKYQDLTGGQV